MDFVKHKVQYEHNIFKKKVKVPVYPKERFSFLLGKIKEIKERIFCFYGESFLCEEAAKEVINYLQEIKSIPYECLDGEEIDESILTEKMLNLSLFSCQKLIWIKNLSNYSHLKPKILQKTPHYLIITSTEGHIPDFLKKLGIIVDFSIKASAKDEQDTWQKQLLNNILKKANKKITPEAQELLLERVGFNLFALKNCLEMLINYAGETELIDVTAVKKLVNFIREESLFEIGDKLIQGNPHVALCFLKNLLEQGVHPLAILSILLKELKALIEVKILQKEKLLKFEPNFSYQTFLKITYPQINRKKFFLNNLHPYAIYRLLKRSFFYSLTDLYSLFKSLIETEYILKSNLKTGIFHLENFIILWCKKVKIY